MNTDRFRFRQLHKCEICGKQGYIEMTLDYFGDWEHCSCFETMPPAGFEVFPIGEYEQCTGLKDKTGKLIFEGDVIRDKIRRTFIVRYIDDDFCWYLEENTTPQIINGFPLQKTWIGIADIEIIGNIHEE